MEPDDIRRRRGPPGPFGPDFDRFFADFERQFAREFEEMQRMMGAVFQDAMRAAERTKPGEPFVYGFKLRVGSDGKPQFESFGNTQVVQSGEGTGEPTVQVGSREPLTDVVEGEGEIAVTIELPGVEKEDISLHVAEDRVTIRAGEGPEGRTRYAKEIRLPGKVVPKTAEATYKNGILDITIQRASPGSSGTRVPIK